jgi:hypothetical protein
MSRLNICLKKIKAPYFVIPGNHDIMPLFRPLKRALKPFERYVEYISDELQPVFIDDEMAIASINTVRPSKIAGGKVNTKQIKNVQSWFKSIGSNHFRIIVTHHPLSLPDHTPAPSACEKSSTGSL